MHLVQLTQLVDAALARYPVPGLRSETLALHVQAVLQGAFVLAVVNFPPRQICPFMSEVLTLGVPDADGAVVLVVPDKEVPPGGKLF